MAVGQAVPVFLLACLLLALAGLHPSALALRQLLLHYGLLGLVALGVTFPLLKGHHDFGAGPLAGLAACCAVLASPHGFLPATAAALSVGCVIGLLEGFLIGWTRLSSAMVTIIAGVVALHLAIYLSATRELVVANPVLVSFGDTDVAGVPVILTLFVLALALGKVLLNQPTFWPVGGAPNRTEAANRTSAPHILIVFGVSGLMAGLAGLLIAGAQLPAVGPTGQLMWVLAPLAAAVIGGGSVAGGTGNLRTVAVGAGVVAVTNHLGTQLNMPVSGPVVEAVYFALGMLCDRYKSMTWHMLTEVRRGNLLALPEELRVPMLLPTVRLPRVGKVVLRALALLVAILGYAYVACYAGGRVPEGKASIADVAGLVELTRSGAGGAVPAVVGDLLSPSDALTTGVASTALVRFPDNSRVRVYENTEMTVQEISLAGDGTSTTRTYVRLGEVFARVSKLQTKRSGFSVDSPFLTVAVRGTSFHLSVGQTDASVRVVEGQVDVIRRSLEADAATGTQVTVEEERTLDAGEWIQALRGHRLASPGVLSATDLTALGDYQKTLATNEWRTLGNWRSWRPFVVLAVVGSLLYLFFTYYQPPPPMGTDDLSRVARRLDATRRRTRDDSPAAVALAQMYLNLGDIGAAQAELQRIVDVDPDSEYGQWALRVLTELERRRQ